MARANEEYLKSLIPSHLPDGREILAQGSSVGASIHAGRSRLVRESRFDNYLEMFKEQAEKDEMFWVSQIGLPTVCETIEGINELHNWSKQLGLNYNFTLSIASTLQAVPKELRNYGIKSTSYIHESLEDYMLLGDIGGMEVMQGDQVLGVPNAWETGINALKAGSYQVGCVSQLMWNHPECEDHDKYVMDMLKVLGILSQKRSEGFGVSGYMDDGFPSYCKDAIAYVAWAMFEHYIINDLCGVRYTVGFGGLISDIHIKAALLKAIFDVLEDEEQPPMLFLHANTTRYWDHDIEANYGMLAQEMLMAILAERRYKTGSMIMPIPITEKVSVPTVEAIKNVLGMTSRLEENIEQWESLVDFTVIDEKAERLKEQGKKMLNGLLEKLDDTGFDIKDPLHMLMFIKNFDASMFEETFHPTALEAGNVSITFYTDMGLLTQKMIDESIKEIRRAGLEGALKGRKVLLGSTDTHFYGLEYVKSVLESSGARVTEAGVDQSVKYIFDIAEEEEIGLVGISTHNGQALGIARQIIKEQENREKTYLPFMGGVLNTILPGHTEPSDVSRQINNMGIFAGNDLVETVRMIKNSVK